MFTNILSDQKSYFATGATLPIKSRISALKRLYHAIKTHETEICNALQQDLKMRKLYVRNRLDLCGNQIYD